MNSSELELSEADFGIGSHFESETDSMIQNSSRVYFSMKSNITELADCSQNILMDEFQSYLNMKWWINGFTSLIVSAFGLSGNLVSFCVLMQPKMRSASFNQLLAVLCIVDSLFLITNSLACGSAFGIETGIVADIGRISMPFVHVSMCASVLLIVAFTFERHFAIRSPHQYRIHIRTTWWAKHLSMYVVPVTILSFIFNIPMFINLDRSWLDDPTYVRVNLYLRVFHPLTSTGLAPMLILVVLNARICRGILMLRRSRDRRNAKRPHATNMATSPIANGKIVSIVVPRMCVSPKREQNKHHRELNMTYIAFGIVVLFFCLNMPRIVIGAYEVSEIWLILKCIEAGSDYMTVITFYKADTFARLLMVINSSVNFLVYCAGSSQFQSVFCDLFIPSGCRLHKTPSSPIEDAGVSNVGFQMKATHVARTQRSTHAGSDSCDETHQPKTVSVVVTVHGQG